MKKNQTNKQNIKNIDQDLFEQGMFFGVGLAIDETTTRYSLANQEFIKAYHGIDQSTGVRSRSSLKGISNYKVNPEYRDANLRQQAGRAAEVATTARDNAEAIIRGEKTRVRLTEDLTEYGPNHQSVDRVQVQNGKPIPGTEAQMKFTKDYTKTIKSIARENGTHKRYRGIDLELPTEQVGPAKQFCQDEIQSRLKQIERLSQDPQSPKNQKIIQKLQNEVQNYEKLVENISDSKMTQDEALKYRTQPRIEITKDMSRVAHRAGLQSLKIGCCVAFSISAIRNIYEVVVNDKKIEDAVAEITVDGAIAAPAAYVGGYLGSIIGAIAGQSSIQKIRGLAKSNAPVAALFFCFSLVGSINKLVQGDVDEVQFLQEVGQIGATTISGAMMAAVGQMVIPVPIVGAVAGGLIGCTIATLFYQSALNAAQQAKASRQRYERIKRVEQAARGQMRQEQAYLDALIARELPQVRKETQQLLDCIANFDNDADKVASAINSFATLLGKNLPFKSFNEFDDFMSSDDSLIL